MLSTSMGDHNLLPNRTDFLVMNLNGTVGLRRSQWSSAVQVSREEQFWI